MATVANREATSAMARGLGWCAFLGAFFSIIDTIRNPRFHNFTSVCIFGAACWALLNIARRIKRTSSANDVQIQATDTIVGGSFGTPPWVRPSIWICLFIVMIGLLAGLFRYLFSHHLRGGTVQIAALAIFALYLLACQQAERIARAHLRHCYPDQPQVAIGAAGLWITGTAIPWASIRSIARKTRRFGTIGVDTIVVSAQAAKRPEDIEIDLSDSVEDGQALYDKLRSAAAAHGAKLLPEGQTFPIGAKAARERAAGARKSYAERLGKLPQEIANSETRLDDVRSRIAESEARIRELEGALLFGSAPRERTEILLEQTRKNLNASLALRNSLEKLLATQRNALEKRR